MIESGISKANKRREPTFLRNIPTFLTDQVWKNDKPHTSRFRNEIHQHITEFKTIKSMKEGILTKETQLRLHTIHVAISFRSLLPFSLNSMKC